MNTECHLYTLPRVESSDDEDSKSEESDLEVISITDDSDHAANTLMNMLNIGEDNGNTSSDEGVNDK